LYGTHGIVVTALFLFIFLIFTFMEGEEENSVLDSVIEKYKIKDTSKGKLNILD
jgi:hypothetical protein